MTKHQVLVPVHRLTTKEFRKIGAWRCHHGHTGLEHYACYIKEHPDEERVGILDIEAFGFNLEADLGIILSYSIKVLDQNIFYEDAISLEDLKKELPEDKRVVKHLISDIFKFDRLITYYGCRFDIPYIRTRALICNLDFPEYGSLVHNDIFFVIKNRFKLSSRKLEYVTRQLLGKTRKTHLEPRYWRAALRGDETALGYVKEHNRADVEDLEDLYHRVIRFSQHRNTSI